MSASRRSFGGLRELPSGRFQATYRDPETGRRVPQTFDTVDEAEHWLEAVPHTTGRRVRRAEVRPARRRRAGRRSFGAIRQLPSGRWQASFVDGNAFRHQAPSTFPSKSEADQWLARQQTHLVGGDWTDPGRGRISFADLAEAFFRTHETAVRRTTLKRDREYTDRYLIPEFGKMAIAAIDLEAVQGWVARLSKSGGAGGKPLAPATVIKANQILGKMLQWGVDSRRIASNPARGVKYPKPQSPKKWVLHQAAVAQLADAIDSRYRAMVFVLAYTGLRIGECLALKVFDVDLKTHEVSVSKRVVDLAGHLDIDEPKTEEAIRTVPMPSLWFCEKSPTIFGARSLGPRIHSSLRLKEDTTVTTPGAAASGTPRLTRSVWSIPPRVGSDPTA